MSALAVTDLQAMFLERLFEFGHDERCQLCRRSYRDVVDVCPVFELGCELDPCFLISSSKSVNAILFSASVILFSASLEAMRLWRDLEGFDQLFRVGEEGGVLNTLCER